MILRRFLRGVMSRMGRVENEREVGLEVGGLGLASGRFEILFA